MEQIIKPKSTGGFVRAVSGLFISKENPQGLTPKECTILAALIFILLSQADKTITKEVRNQLGNMTNHSHQVVTNYINKLKQKGVITEANRLHEVLTRERITILWNVPSAT